MTRALPWRIGARIRALRLEHAHLTQEQLAEDLGVAVETISRIERNKLAPSADLIGRIAHALKVKPGDLFEDRPVGPPPKDLLRPVERQLLRLVRKLDDQAAEDLLRGIKLVMDAGRTRRPSRS